MTETINHIHSARDAVAEWLQVAVAPVDSHGRRVLIECAHCNRTRNHRQDWAMIPEDLRPENHVVSHGICGSCLHHEFPDVWVALQMNGLK